MSQIDVKTKKLKKEVNELDQLSSELRGIISDIESCRNRVDTQSLATAINALRKISEGVNLQKDTVNSMKKALQDILHLYEETEKKITEEGRKAYKEADGDSMLSDLLNKLKEMLSNLGNNGGGKQEQGAFDGDPVNVCTGNYFLVKDEIKINGLYPIHFALYFNGAQPVFTNVGTGWTHSYLNWLRTEGDSIVIHRGDGKEESFRQCGLQMMENLCSTTNRACLCRNRISTATTLHTLMKKVCL